MKENRGLMTEGVIWKQLLLFALPLLLGNLFGMNGVWAAFPAAEALTAVLTACLLRRVVRRTEE